jgi:hypothetical protein
MNDPDLAEIHEEWAGFMPKLCAGLNRMRKVINALVRAARRLGGGGADSTPNLSLYCFVAIDGSSAHAGSNLELRRVQVSGRIASAPITNDGQLDDE